MENDDLNGELGNDLVVQTADVDQSLTNTTLTGLGNDSYATVERIQLVGGLVWNRFDLSGYTGAALVDGREGIDTIVSTADADDWSEPLELPPVRRHERQSRHPSSGRNWRAGCWPTPSR